MTGEVAGVGRVESAAVIDGNALAAQVADDSGRRPRTRLCAVLVTRPQEVACLFLTRPRGRAEGDR